MITALIRTHPGREQLTEIAIASATSQGCNTIVHYGDKTPGFEYNLYCNDLKARVTEGYFFFLDSDDYILPGSIESISQYLEPDAALVCQMLRNGFAKPRHAKIEKGRIGMPCMILHHSHKFIADVTANEYGDYEWVKNVCDKIPWKFVPIVLVNAGKRNRGL